MHLDSIICDLLGSHPGMSRSRSRSMEMPCLSSTHSDVASKKVAGNYIHTYVRCSSVLEIKLSTATKEDAAMRQPFASSAVRLNWNEYKGRFDDRCPQDIWQVVGAAA